MAQIVVDGTRRSNAATFGQVTYVAELSASVRLLRRQPGPRAERTRLITARYLRQTVATMIEVDCDQLSRGL